MTIHSERHTPDTRGEQADRTCLACGRRFHSQHRGNRICGRCKPVVERMAEGMDCREFGTRAAPGRVG